MKKLHFELSILRFTLILASLLCLMEVTGRFYDLVKFSHSKKRTASAFFNPFHGTEVVNFQGVDYPVKKLKGVFRILVFGGSAAQGNGLDIKKSWSYFLQETLQKQNLPPFKKIEVINLANGSYTSIDDYVNLVKYGLPLSPDLVIIYNGWNDIESFFDRPGWTIHNVEAHLAETYGQLESYDRHMLLQTKLKRQVFIARKYFRLKRKIENAVTALYSHRNAARYALLDWLTDRKMVPSLPVKDQEETLVGDSSAPSFGQILMDTDIHRSYLTTYPRFKNEMTELFKRYYRVNLESISRELNRHEIKGLYIFQPDLLYEATWRPLTGQEQKVSERLLGEKSGIWMQIVKEVYPEGARIMQEVASVHRIGFIDMSREIEKYRDRPLFIDSVHNSLEGNRVIAKEIYKFILKYKSFFLFVPLSKSAPSVVMSESPYALQ